MYRATPPFLSFLNFSSADMPDPHNPQVIILVKEQNYRTDDLYQKTLGELKYLSENREDFCKELLKDIL
jgi:hypothetical protein